AAATFLHPLPEVDVIVVLTDVVDDRRIFGREGRLADILDRFAFVFGAGAGNLVAIVDVGLVMLVVVKLQRLGGHVGRQGIVSVGELGKLEGQGGSPLGSWEDQ